MKTAEEILEINKQQKEYYNTKKRNFITEFWSKLRSGFLGAARKELGIQQEVYSVHEKWFGDLKDKKVLDLGCFSGNRLSIYLAQHSKEYIGLDLSDVAIAKLNKKLEPYPSAKALAADFLSDAEFPQTGFDLIYAYGVLHHFQNTDVLISRLNDKLVPGGIIVSYDPLETSVPVKIVRALYRPFQSDKHWEWPFTRNTFQKLNNAFNILERHGVLGKSKWYTLMKLLPYPSGKKLNAGKKWHRQDWEQSAVSDDRMFACMHLTLKMQKKANH